MPAVLLALCLPLILFASEPAPIPGGAEDPGGLKTFRNCAFVETDWGDGDSFRVRLPDGSEWTLRLYGADCFEWHVNDQSDARRLREQRRYFGFSGDAESSIALAREMGRQAAARTKDLLTEPFTVYTAFADALGDKRFKRVYGFIETADGRDLATVLVSEGLARAHGVYRRGPQGVAANEYHDRLADLELTAAKADRGVWKKTDWARLAGERQALRDEEAELSLGLGKTQATTSSRVDPNSATKEQLMSLPGIGEGLAEKIIAGRVKGRYQTPSDLDRVPGIGPKLIERLAPLLLFP